LIFDLNKVPLEDEGSKMSKNAHFEKLTFGDEIMVSDDFINAKFSKMTLSVAKDSGFYEINLRKGDYYTWGKSSGCSLLNRKCNEFLSSDICSKENQISCSPDHRLRRKCKFINFSDGCGVNQNLVNCRTYKKSDSKVFTYGPNSVCLNSKVNPEL
jgi:hypothetical protein